MCPYTRFDNNSKFSVIVSCGLAWLCRFILEFSDLYKVPLPVESSVIINKHIIHLIFIKRKFLLDSEKYANLTTTLYQLFVSSL
jgi:hypothetical protein